MLPGGTHPAASGGETLLRPQDSMLGRTGPLLGTRAQCPEIAVLRWTPGEERGQASRQTELRRHQGGKEVEDTARCAEGWAGGRGPRQPISLQRPVSWQRPGETAWNCGTGTGLTHRVTDTSQAVILWLSACSQTCEPAPRAVPAHFCSRKRPQPGPPPPHPVQLG